MNTKLSIFILFIFFLLVGITNISAQEFYIKGKVVDNSQKSIEYINVSLLQNNKILINQTVTNSSGEFSLSAPAGKYTLLLEQLGKEMLKKEILLNNNINLGEVVVNQSVVLNEVVVTSRKKLVEQKIDRMVFNVENSIASQGMNGLDALRNTPLVRVMNDNVSIIGKGDVAIMVNDKLLNLAGSDLTNYLQSLRSDDIARIEVITTPPSKYDAQGNSGIINIILKKNLNVGWSGTASSSYQRTTKNGYQNGVTLNYQSNNLSSSLKFRHYDVGLSPIGTRDLIAENYKIFTSERREDRIYGTGINYSLDIKLNKKSSIGFIYDVGKSKYNMDSNNSSTYEFKNVKDSTLNTFAKHRWSTPTHTLNVYYDLKIDTLGKKLSIIGNYLNTIPEKINDFETTNFTTNRKLLVKNSSQMNYNIYSAQADFTLPYHWSKVETGLKYTLLHNKSDVNYYNYNGLVYVINPANSNAFHYKENNYAAYVSLQKDFNTKWSAKAGLRYEFTTLEGFTPQQEKSNVHYKYGRVFPTFFISYKPNENKVFSVNYSKRINRPDFQSLNPFRWYTNPYSYYSGTPTLTPSFNDNIEFSLTYKNKLTFSMYYQITTNGYNSIARFSDGVYSNVMENSFDQYKTGIKMMYYDTFFKFWDASFSLNGSYGHTQPTILELEKLNVYTLYYSINNTLTLNKDKTWFLLLNFWHSLPFVYGNTYIEKQLEFSPGIKTSFFKKTLQISAVLSDAFKTIKNNGYTSYAGYRENFTQYNDYRKFTFSLTFSFGNKKVKEGDKNIQFEEKNRAN